jgi:hypothetical protein
MNGKSRVLLVLFCTFFLTTPCYASPVTGTGLMLAAVFFIGLLVFMIGSFTLCCTYKIHSARQCNYLCVLFVECIFGAIIATKASDFMIVVFVLCAVAAMSRLVANWDKVNIPSQDKSRADRLAIRIIMIPPITIISMLLIGMMSKIFG